MQEAGAGELLLTSIDRDGTRAGYDLELVARVSAAVSVPVIAAGGAGSTDHLRQVLSAGAAAAAAGSLFVYSGRNQAVLVSYVTPAQLEQGAV
jgi:cyclase